MTSASETQTINGVSIHYTLDGPAAAPVITLAHALSLDLRSFDPQVPAFRDRYRVLRLDLRGHGQSDRDGGPFSMEDLAGDVVGLLDQIGVERTHFVGSSLGAMAGLALAFDHGDRLSSLTFMASQGALPEAGINRAKDDIAALRASGATAQTTLADQADAMIDRLIHDADGSADPACVAALHRILETTTGFGQARAYEAIFAMNYDSRLAEVQVPTLVLAGAEDKSTPPARMQMYKDDIAGARMEVLSGAGHFPNLEQPAAFNAVLAQFLDQVSA